MRAIVTGGAGFIGSFVSEALLARGDEVHVVDDLSSGDRGNVPDGATFHEIDIRSEGLTDLVAARQPEAIFHLAAQADVGTSVEQPVFDAEVNVVGTIRVLEAARAAGSRVVFTSTGGAIYGECDRPAREEDERRPLSPYGTAKLAGEEYLATWNRLYGASHVVCRLANVYGPRQLPSLEGGVVAIFLDRLARSEEVQIFGDGNQTRDFVYVGDVVEALLVAATASGPGLFNVGTGNETSILELFALCAEAAGVDGRPPKFAPARPGDLSRSVLDTARSASELGWSANTSLAAGLAQIWASARERKGH